MKTIIAGGRNIGYSKDTNKMIKDLFMIFEHINKCPWKITEVVSGKAKGVDTAGELWACARGIHVEPFEANWPLYGLSAGPIRNEEMAIYADALILVWDGKSKGSTDMFELHQLYNLKFHELRI